MLQVARSGFVAPPPAETAALADTFATDHCVRLRGFLEPALVAWAHRRLADAVWDTCVHGDLDPPAIDLSLRDEVMAGVMLALMNDPRLLETIRAITRVDEIRSFGGRVYRMDPGPAHHDTWHDDMDKGRLVAVSVNLSPVPFEGGELSLRRQHTTDVIMTVANTGPGDAILFRLSNELEHRVGGVGGTAPKIAYAGWFNREPVRLAGFAGSC